jgi:hypothetical protein
MFEGIIIGHCPYSQGVDGHGNTVLNCPASSSQEKGLNLLF